MFVNHDSDHVILDIIPTIMMCIIFIILDLVEAVLGSRAVDCGEAGGGEGGGDQEGEVGGGEFRTMSSIFSQV